MRTYQAKLSGPLLDRIDLHIEVGPPTPEALIDDDTEETSAVIRNRVLAARERQAGRLGTGRCNAHLTGREAAQQVKLGREERRFLRRAAASAQLSARAIHRVLKVAQTIADLTGSDEVTTEHLAEALQFRPQLEAFG